jgi:hypothetical protein
MIEIEYDVREQDLIAFNEHQLHNSEPVQKLLKRHQTVVPSIFAAIATLVLLLLRDIPASIVMGIAAALWGGLVPLYLKWSWRKQIGKMYSESDKAQVLGHYTLRLLPKELVEITDKGESRIPWQDVLRVEVAKNYAFIFVSLDSALIIPRATVNKAANLHEFVKQVDQYISDAE